MTFEALLAQLRSLDVRYAIGDGRVHICAPKGALDDGLLQAVTLHREKLWSLLIDIERLWGSAYQLEKVFTGWAADLDDAEAAGMDMTARTQELEEFDSLRTDLEDAEARAKHLERISGATSITMLEGRWLWHDLMVEFPVEDGDGPGTIRVVVTV